MTLKMITHEFEEKMGKLLPFLQENVITIPNWEEGDYRLQLNLWRYINLKVDGYESLTFKEAATTFQNNLAFFATDGKCPTIYVEWSKQSERDYSFNPEKVYVEFSFMIEGNPTKLKNDEVFDIDSLLQRGIDLFEWLEENRWVKPQRKS